MSNPFAVRGQTRKLGTDERSRLYERTRTADLSPRASEPRLVGDGPVEFHTSLVIDCYSRIIWDTNGFYRAIGADPHASRRDIQRAGLRRLLELGPDDPRTRWTHHAVRVLLSKKLRSKYDATPLGLFWADDERLVRPEHLDDDDTEMQIMRTDPWAYYVVALEDDALDEDTMAEWRSLLCIVMGDDATRVEPCLLALGLCPGTNIVIGEVGFRMVVFVPVASKPSEAYASDIARWLAANATVTTVPTSIPGEPT